ncbi:MAG: hypothetical protein KAW66_08355 [Candidatus Lokiarchaeota archaeon]|nr:hypothetical protein [Candidatus Lokiarchaeota archaeon]
MLSHQLLLLGEYQDHFEELQEELIDPSEELTDSSGWLEGFKDELPKLIL